MSRIPRLVPYVSWEEWHEVFGQLFSPSADVQCIGIKRVNAWRSRGRVPFYIDATATLVELILAEGSASSSWARSNMELRLMYSMVLTRLVNEAVERLQTGTYAQSVSVLASKISLPRVLVDIRHEATHKELPGLALLRRGASVALKWLYEYFWVIQSSHLQNLQETILEMLHEYSYLKSIALQSENGKGEEEDLEASDSDQDGNEDLGSYFNVLASEVSLERNITTKKSGENHTDMSIHEIRGKCDVILRDLTATITPSVLQSMLIPTLLDRDMLIPIDIQFPWSESLDRKDPPNLKTWFAMLQRLLTIFPQLSLLLLKELIARIITCINDSDQTDRMQYLFSWTFYMLRSSFVSNRNSFVVMVMESGIEEYRNRCDWVNDLLRIAHELADDTVKNKHNTKRLKTDKKITSIKGTSLHWAIAGDWYNDCPPGLLPGHQSSILNVGYNTIKRLDLHHASFYDYYPSSGVNLQGKEEVSINKVEEGAGGLVHLGADEIEKAKNDLVDFL